MKSDQYLSIKFLESLYILVRTPSIGLIFFFVFKLNVHLLLNRLIIMRSFSWPMRSFFPIDILRVVCRNVLPILKIKFRKCSLFMGRGNAQEWGGEDCIAVVTLSRCVYIQKNIDTKCNIQLLRVLSSHKIKCISVGRRDELVVLTAISLCYS